jgi:hypothetical protein
MEHEEHKELIPRDNNHSQEITNEHRLRAAQVPSSLLPMVLLRLGLSSDSLLPEISVDTLVELLQSEQWEERLNAVRMLGRLGSGVPVDLLSTALDDNDGSVRAATLFALGNAGHHAPLHRLVAALNDTDWHVRETAVLALSKQGERVPQEVLQIALHDADSSVRDAVSLALQRHSSTDEHEQPAVYDGQQWEQHIMQQKEAHKNGTSHLSSQEDGISTFVAYNHSSGAIPRVLREQQQSYAAQNPIPGEQWQSYTRQTPLESSSGGQMQMFAPPLETSSDERANGERQRDPISEPSHQEEYSSAASSGQGEKVTSLPRQNRSSKGWWVLIAIVALLFFLLGRMIAIPTSPVPIGFPSSISVGQDQKFPKGISLNDKGIPFEKLLLNSQSLSRARLQIADGLHLSPDEITQQLSAGNSMQDIASSQGVDPDQLHNIELKAITSLIDSEMKAGNIDEKNVNEVLNRLQNNPDTLDKLTSHLFTAQSPAGGAQSTGAVQLFSNPNFSNQAQTQIALALHLSPQDITTQLQAGKNLADIAVAQGLTNDQLRSAELQAYTNVANAAVKSGDLTRSDADAWLKDLSNNSQDLEKTTTNLFLNTNQPSNG